MGDTLQIYALYVRDSPIWDDTIFLILDYDDKVIKGLMFDKNTLKMTCGFTINNDVVFRRIGYCYTPNEGFYLQLMQHHK